MAWYDEVNATWKQVGLEVGAEFQFQRSHGVPSIRRKGKRAHIYEGKLVRRTEEWTLTLEYKAVAEIEYDDFNEFHTTTTMKAGANTENAHTWIGSRGERVFLKEVSKEEAPRLLRALMGPNWMLPIKDHDELVALFRSSEDTLAELENREESSGPETERAERRRELLDDTRRLLSARVVKHEKEAADEDQRLRDWHMVRKGKLLDEARRLCVRFAGFGMDARVLERAPAPDDKDSVYGWIEIPEGPIRWVLVNDEPQEFLTCWMVPDPRIKLDSPFILVNSSPVKSRRFLGRVTGIRWTSSDAALEPTGFSQRVAATLDDATAATQREVSSKAVGSWAETDPARGCWAILNDKGTTKWTGAL